MKWRVIVNGDVLFIEADYHRVEGGVLTFRDCSRNGQYPEVVRVLAPDYWRDVSPVVPLPAPPDILGEPIQELSISIRSLHALMNANIVTIGDLVKHSAHDLRTFSNFGKKSLQDVQGALGERGLSLSLRGMGL